MHVWQRQAVSLDDDGVIDGALSLDGLLSEYRYSRYLPFEVARIDKALWQWCITDFCRSDGNAHVGTSSRGHENAASLRCIDTFCSRSAPLRQTRSRSSRKYNCSRLTQR